MNTNTLINYSRKSKFSILALILILIFLIVTTVFAVWNAPVIVDSANNVGQYTSLAVVNGNPAISYYDVTNGDLLYARALDASGVSWGSPVTVTVTGDVGQYTSLAVVNGNPAISFYDVSNGDLVFVRANDANGSSWASPVLVDSLNDVGQHTSMIVVNGRPAISYFDVTDGDLKYARANDANGSSWGSPVPVDPVGIVGEYSSLAIVNGNPAISYYDNPNGDLFYIRALDVDGATWDLPFLVDSTNDAGLHSSLVVVNGNPAISYHSRASFGPPANRRNVKFVRAADADGNTWGAPIVVDNQNGGDDQLGIFEAISMAVVNGNPALSYYDEQNGDLTYTRASDANGAAWDDPVPIALDSADDVGGYTSLAMVNGFPAISYYDFTNGDLKYISEFTQADPEPEIDVLGNNQSIPDGDTTPSTIDDTDFGSTAVTGGTVIHTFTISNIGPGDLTLTGTPAVTLASGANFAVTVQPNSPVLSNDTTTFQVTFDPTSAGNFTDTVTIANSDIDENPYTFVISGTGTESITNYNTYLPVIMNTRVFLPIPINETIIERRPVVEDFEVFYTRTEQVGDWLPPGGTFYLSYSISAPQVTQVDDAVSFLLEGQEIFSFDYSQSGAVTPALVEVPRTIMEQMAGKSVTFIFRDIYSYHVYAEPMYLIWVP